MSFALQIDVLTGFSAIIDHFGELSEAAESLHTPRHSLNTSPYGPTKHRRSRPACACRTCLRRCRRGSSTSSGFSAVPFSALLAPEALLSEWARLRLCSDLSCSALWSRSETSCHSTQYDVTLRTASRMLSRAYLTRGQLQKPLLCTSAVYWLMYQVIKTCHCTQDSCAHSSFNFCCLCLLVLFT